MDLEELRSAQRTERQRDSLQHLRDSFYEEAAAYISDLKREREAAADAADDPYTDPEVGRLSDRIQTAQDVVEAVYERRVGKVVKHASFAAADMPTETEGMTAEERELFTDLVDRIRHNRDAVLDMLAGRTAPGSTTDTAAENTTDATPDTGRQSTGTGDPDPDDVPARDDADASDPGRPHETSNPTAESADASGAAAGVDADTDSEPPIPPDEPETHATPASGAVEDVLSEAMGGTDPTGTDEAPGRDAGPDDGVPSRDGGAADAEPTPPDHRGDGGTVTERSGRAAESGDGRHVADASEATAPAPVAAEADGSEPPASGTESSRSAAESVAGRGARGRDDTDRVTLRITADVGTIVGVDEREYDLANEDVVTLPAANAEPLLTREAAERLD